MNGEKAMAPHSSTLAWEIPWMEEPGKLQSMGSLRVGHDWVTSFSLFTFMRGRRKWQPTPVFLSGESQGREPGGLTWLSSSSMNGASLNLFHTLVQKRQTTLSDREPTKSIYEVSSYTFCWIIWFYSSTVHDGTFCNSGNILHLCWPLAIYGYWAPEF